MNKNKIKRGSIYKFKLHRSEYQYDDWVFIHLKNKKYFFLIHNKIIHLLQS